jgi:carbamoyl-phosphate synthase small subunit
LDKKKIINIENKNTDDQTFDLLGSKDRGVEKMKGILYLQDGTRYEGKGFGKRGTTVGELVFNTSMIGYQRVLTDPSYAGQIVMMTYPLIGNYGICDSEFESSTIHARGLIVKSVVKHPSNNRSNGTLDDFIRKAGIVGISDVDTRSITKKIRSEGVLKCVISNEDLSETELKMILEKTPLREDWMKKVSTKKQIHIPGESFKIAILDLGVETNTINHLKEFGYDMHVFPMNSSYETIMECKPVGMLISSGPGNPKEAVETIRTVKQLIGNIPIFGVGMGHQILALAVGGDTYKMKCGHRGANHGVYDIKKDKAYITFQNHGYAVERKSVESNGMIITHTNLNDETVEGMKHKDLPIFSVQFHPEGAKGFSDSGYLFEQFLSYLREGDA